MRKLSVYNLLIVVFVLLTPPVIGANAVRNANAFNDRMHEVRRDPVATVATVVSARGGVMYSNMEVTFFDESGNSVATTIYYIERTIGLSNGSQVQIVYSRSDPTVAYRSIDGGPHVPWSISGGATSVPLIVAIFVCVELLAFSGLAFVAYLLKNEKAIEEAIHGETPSETI